MRPAACRVQWLWFCTASAWPKPYRRPKLPIVFASKPLSFVMLPKAVADEPGRRKRIVFAALLPRDKSRFLAFCSAAFARKSCAAMMAAAPAFLVAVLMAFTTWACHSFVCKAFDTAFAQWIPRSVMSEEALPSLPMASAVTGFCKPCARPLYHATWATFFAFAKPCDQASSCFGESSCEDFAMTSRRRLNSDRRISLTARQPASLMARATDSAASLAWSPASRLSRVARSTALDALSSAFMASPLDAGLATRSSPALRNASTVCDA
mmetsp:Transcript_107118/g.345634  ORF Transcript_107118/g.345634 Transcript_107118/m.345634 type:complete len:267 (+) Transcript_107118:485-1285(+)